MEELAKQNKLAPPYHFQISKNCPSTLKNQAI